MPAPPEASRLRLDRFVSQGLELSRGQARRLVAAGQVQVDGTIVRDAAMSVTPAHAVEVDGNPLPWPRHYHVMVHKPLGVVCSTSDPVHTPVHQLVDRPWAGRLHAAGRLDANTTGFVLLTSDGAFSHALTSPRRHRDKRYRVTLNRPLTPDLVERFAAGIVLDDDPRPTLPADLDIVDAHTAVVTLREGRYHQVRRMFAACGNHVDALHREALGGVTLDAALAPGEWRELTPGELRMLDHE